MLALTKLLYKIKFFVFIQYTLWYFDITSNYTGEIRHLARCIKYISKIEIEMSNIFLKRLWSIYNKTPHRYYKRDSTV